MIALEIVEKLFWTAFDLIVLRPVRFRQSHLDNPSKYMEPIPFAASMFILYQIALVGTVRFISPLVDWAKVTGMAVRIPEIPDATTLLVFSAPYALFSYLFFAVIMMLGARLTGQKLKMRDTLVGMCYASATLLILIGFIGIGGFMVFYVGIMSGEATSTAAFFCSGFNILNFLLLIYFVSGAAAFGGIKFGKLLLGTILGFVLIFVISLLLGGILGYFFS
jgi:hypothetical protein